MQDDLLLLAYLGDAVFEVLVRERLVEREVNTSRANATALQYVTAQSQSSAIKKNLELLTEEERAVFTRGKNSKANSGPRNIDPYHYRLATGLEAVFGYLHLKGREERKRELFNLLFPLEEDVNKK